MVLRTVHDFASDMCAVGRNGSSGDTASCDIFLILRRASEPACMQHSNEMAYQVGRHDAGLGCIGCQESGQQCCSVPLVPINRKWAIALGRQAFVTCFYYRFGKVSSVLNQLSKISVRQHIHEKPNRLDFLQTSDSSPVKSIPSTTGNAYKSKLCFRCVCSARPSAGLCNSTCRSRRGR